eukprot:867586-Prymnesium_polylepis.1
MGAKTLGEEERFVNVAGGRRKRPEIAAAMGWLQQKGWGHLATLEGYTMTHARAAHHGQLGHAHQGGARRL